MGKKFIQVNINATLCIRQLVTPKLKKLKSLTISPEPHNCSQQSHIPIAPKSLNCHQDSQSSLELPPNLHSPNRVWPIPPNIRNLRVPAFPPKLPCFPGVVHFWPFGAGAPTSKTALFAAHLPVLIWFFGIAQNWPPGRVLNTRRFVLDLFAFGLLVAGLAKERRN
jgi:hypothetical protein